MKKKRMCNRSCSSRHVKNGKNLKMWPFEEVARWNASEFTPVGVKRKWFFFKILDFKICEGNKPFQLYTWRSSRHVFVKNFSKLSFLGIFWATLCCAKCNNSCSSRHDLVTNFQNWVSLAYFGQLCVAQNATTHAVVSMLSWRIFKSEFLFAYFEQIYLWYKHIGLTKW